MFDGAVELSATATPPDPAALRLRAPLAKLAEPLTPSAVFRVLRKLDEVKLTGAAPSTVMVLASKSMSMRDCSTPLWSTTATVLWPVKPEMPVGRSRPVSRPVRVVGGGTALEALCARLIWSTAWLTYWFSCSEMAGNCWFRMARRPWTVPLPAVSGRGTPPGRVTWSCPAAAPEPE